VEKRKMKRRRTVNSSQDEQILLPLGQPMSEEVRQDTGRMMTNALFQHRSNRLEVLAAELAGLLASPNDAPLQKEIVIAPSLAMRRWLTLEIARLNGVCANVSFPFLGDFISSLPPQVLSPSPQERIPPEEMIWAIHRILPALLQEPEFRAVKAYLSDSDPLKLFQLSKRIAELFDQYAVYRPEMAGSWESSSTDKLTGDEAWQRSLWRALTADEGVRQAKEKSPQANAHRLPADLPSRLFVFGLTAIPPIYLDVLFQLAKTRPVHLFLLQPSNEYHGDDLTPKQRARRKIPETEAPTGNPLLSSLGRAETQLTELLIDADERLGGVLVDQKDKFAAPETANLLGTLQADIFSAVNRPANATSPDESLHRFSVQPDDESLVIHSCHSPMREVEVVYERLLHLFEKDSTLRPRDILVLTPDIEKYSPLIHAVFEYTEHTARKIPYSVSDRHPRSASVVVDSFLQVLELSTNRCTAEEVFALISSPLIAQRFEFSEDDLAQIRTWIRETHICWGIDGSQRERLGLPPTQANTWRFGFDRLLLGYAMRGRNARLFDHVLPYDEVEGEGGELLGRFVSAVETIFSFVNGFGIARPLAEWTPLLRETVDQLFQSDDEEYIRDLRFLRRTFLRLETVASDLRANQSVDVRVLRTHLGHLLGAMEQRGGFLTGAVTFAALKPGRSIPARVIFLLGMNDEVFPRRPQPAQFDLMAKWRLGDPSPREDDRYAFLETICAAKDSLQISYVGRSNIHNQEIPPSIVVNELLDYVEQACTFPKDATARKQILIEHPLQAFSPRYFDRDDERLFSYSEANAAAATALVNPRTSAEPMPFLASNLPAASSVERAITLNQLISFLAEPARFFLRARFRMDLKEYDDSLPDDEPLELGPLEKYWIQQDLLTEWIDTGASNLEVFTARGVTASGVLGQLQLRSFDRDAAAFRSTVLPHIRERRAEPIAIDLALGEFTLSGPIESVYGSNIVHYRSATLKARDRLRAWVEHLARSAADKNGQFKTILIGKDDVVVWSPVATAAELLTDLCQLYWRGLHEPVPFFPRSGLAYALAEHGGGGNPVSKARAAWYGDFRSKNGENHDPHIIELFPHPDPVGEESIALARQVWAPLLEHAD
jgi:exodeoxyribonuclease V gamma subunit